MKSRIIISFLKPLSIETNINSLKELDNILLDIPPYTILPIDFFESVLMQFPHYKEIAEGCWVEIGVWKGGGALFFKALMTDLGIEQPLYLFDTFGKIPTFNFKHSKDIIFATHYGIGKNNLFDRGYQIEVELLFREHKLERNVNFVPSDICNLPSTKVPNNIAFLHLDVDFYEPTFSALNLFYDNVLSGGKIIIDDYYMQLLNCKDAVDDFFSHRKIDISTISEKFSMYSIIITKP